MDLEQWFLTLVVCDLQNGIKYKMVTHVVQQMEFGDPKVRLIRQDEGPRRPLAPVQEHCSKAGVSN